jgi:hypothetical protein
MLNTFIQNAKANKELIANPNIKLEDAVKEFGGYKSSSARDIADEWVRNTLGREVTETDRKQQWYKDAVNDAVMNTYGKAQNIYGGFKTYAQQEAAANTAKAISDAKSFRNSIDYLKSKSSDVTAYLNEIESAKSKVNSAESLFTSGLSNLNRYQKWMKPGEVDRVKLEFEKFKTKLNSSNDFLNLILIFAGVMTAVSALESTLNGRKSKEEEEEERAEQRKIATIAAAAEAERRRKKREEDEEYDRHRRNSYSSSSSYSSGSSSSDSGSSWDGFDGGSSSGGGSSDSW